MNIKPYITILCSVLVLSAASGAMAGGARVQVVEDFTTSTYCNVATTTAWWDTGTHQLRLHPFVPRLAGGYDTPGWAGHVVVAGDYAYVSDSDNGLVVCDITNPAAPTLAGHYDTPGWCRSLALAGNYAYVADGDGGGLRVIDVTDPTNPVEVGSYTALENPYWVALHGNTAYVFDPFLAPVYGIHILDITNPATPVFSNSVFTAYFDRAAAIGGDYLYVAGDTGGLDIFDITNPDTIASVKRVYLTRSYDVALTAQHAYVADSESGLRVVDISDPHNASLVRTVDTPGTAWGVGIDGNYLYVADSDQGLRAFDISDPVNPVLLHTYDTGGTCVKVTVAGEHAFTADGEAGLTVVKVCDNVGPTYISGYDTPGEAVNLAVDGHYAYVADRAEGLQVIDVADPTAPTLVGTFPSPGEVRDVVIKGQYAFVANHQNGLLVLDIGDPTHPTELGRIDTYPFLVSLAVEGDVAWGGCDRSGFYTYDVTDISAMFQGTRIATIGTIPWHTEVDGNWIYIGHGLAGTFSWNITDPLHPTGSLAYYSPNTIDVEVAGDVLYAADYNNGFYIFDISNRGAIAYLNHLPTPGNAQGVVADGDFAFVADGDAGLHVYNVSNPAAPALVGTVDTPGSAYRVEVAGDYAFVADGTAGLQVIQVFQRAVDRTRNVAVSLVMPQGEEITEIMVMPFKSGTFHWSASTTGIIWDEVPDDDQLHPLTLPGTDFCWKAEIEYEGGPLPWCDVVVFDSEYFSAVAISAFAARAVDGGVELAWEITADEPIEGFRVYRGASPDGERVLVNHDAMIAPEARSFTDTGADPYVPNWYVLTAVTPGGEQFPSRVVRAEPIVRPFALKPNYPNPFNPTTRIGYSLDRAARVTLTIHDVSGHRVRTLVDRAMAPGSYEEEWDGRDAGGQVVGSGVYFYRLKAGKRVLTRKMLLLK